MTTETPTIGEDLRAPVGRRPNRRRTSTGAGPDRLSVVLFSVACFLTLLALLASQVRLPKARPPQPVLLRKIYQTTVITTIARGAGPNRTSLSQSVSTAGAPAIAPPTTRVS